MTPITYLQEMWQLAIDGQTQGLWFWITLYAFITCTYSLIFLLRTRTWPSTADELVALGVEKIGGKEPVRSNQEYLLESLYSYRVADMEYAGRRISPWVFVASHNLRSILEKQLSSVQQMPDGKVKVFYNPNNPKKSYLIVAGKTGIAITFLIGTLPLALYVYRYHG
ncbi:DUF3592 domain-containing protein [Motiliproteus sp.]|uniref:DUF3592 domain-containing protein n=1 Tax=Motiliproteus sp. TaxID=1898955 RepID=UPI003BACD5C0